VLKSGHERPRVYADFHDLYVEGFQPVIADEESRHVVSHDPLVEQHGGEVAAADGIIVVHPNGWGQPPAILKGWIDRVMRPGMAYD
jgi:putative NADPH-quinone reductase